MLLLILFFSWNTRCNNSQTNNYVNEHIRINIESFSSLFFLVPHRSSNGKKGDKNQKGQPNSSCHLGKRRKTSLKRLINQWIRTNCNIIVNVQMSVDWWLLLQSRSGIDAEEDESKAECEQDMRKEQVSIAISWDWWLNICSSCGGVNILCLSLPLQGLSISRIK